MGNGRWVKQPNGDYQHFTDEEIEEQDKIQIAQGGAICFVVGAAMMLYNMFNIDVPFYVGCFLVLIGVICLFLYPKEVIVGIILYGIIAGLAWHFLLSKFNWN